jgi:hypothetical protein
MLRRYTLVALLLLILAMIVITVLPGQVACALSPVFGFKTLEDGALADEQLDTKRLLQLTVDARHRIEQTFGASVAQPKLIFFKSEQGIGVFKLNRYASTHFLGSGSCITVGPAGQSVDVIAHELMHAELHERVGHWKRFFEIPTWFDEGLAMQVDYRSKFDMRPTDGKVDVSSIRQLNTGKDFFTDDEATLTKHYAFAKESVRRWLWEVGNDSLYVQLNKIKQGQRFTSVIH